jgi:hypothetical protein
MPTTGGVKVNRWHHAALGETHVLVAFNATASIQKIWVTTWQKLDCQHLYWIKHQHLDATLFRRCNVWSELMIRILTLNGLTKKWQNLLAERFQSSNIYLAVRYTNALLTYKAKILEICQTRRIPQLIHVTRIWRFFNTATGPTAAICQPLNTESRKRLIILAIHAKEGSFQLNKAHFNGSYIYCCSPN